jgi:hypothetical protein
MEKVLSAPNAKMVAQLYLEGVAEFAVDTNGRNPPGCLLVQSGLSCSDQDIPDMLAEHRAEKERALRERFEKDRKEGNLPKSANPAALASYLVAMTNGMCVQAAAGASAKELSEVVQIALAAWPVNDEPKTKKPVRAVQTAK